MSLEELFRRITENYAAVRAQIDAIYKPYKIAIDTHWGKAKIYAGRLDWRLYHNWTEFAGAVKNYGYEVVWLLEDFIDEMFLSVNSTKGRLQTAFNSYMADVIADVKNAIQLVYDEIWQAVEDVRVDVWAELQDLEDYIHDEVTRMYERMEQMELDVIGWIDESIAELTTILLDRIETVETSLTERIDFIETWLGEVVTAVYLYIDAQNAELKAYIDEADATLYVYINNRVKELQQDIDSLRIEINMRIDREVIALLKVIESTELSLSEKINELVDVTTWNFTFFGLFTFRPELSLLRVLLRSQDEFERYKPYWQALFAKVLSEEE